ncbi:hypothetical protein GW813_09885 [bacterium]|nr:hypothetical protein [bacterium]PIV81911.1 MAG: hypothetical protein COW53_01805 [bacterium CG17_big_fil_post_rev_8_21_14_2_50_64_8]PJA74022.1 MAG: hypothetical protein CO151_11665 [bacterium CG_4_9_14_3_um_filter_65_15]
MQSVRNYLHYLFAILLWILFGYYWYIVSGRRLTLATFQALFVLGAVSLLGLLLTVLWVRHNKNIARQNRRSGSRAKVPESMDHDHLGRPVLGPPQVQLQAAGVISIDIDADGNKVYAAAGRVTT